MADKSEKKVTKIDVLNAIIDVFAKQQEFEVTLENEVTVTALDILNYASVTIDQINAKAARAAEKAREKAEKGDELLPVIKGALCEDYLSVEELLARIGDEELTRNKVVSRLTKLVKDGVALKDSIKVKGRKSKLTVYKLA